MIDFIDDFKMRTYITRLNASNLTSRELFAILTERNLKASSLEDTAQLMSSFYTNFKATVLTS